VHTTPTQQDFCGISEGGYRENCAFSIHDPLELRRVLSPRMAAVINVQDDGTPLDYDDSGTTLLTHHAATRCTSTKAT
jgi:hypothetical protein